VLPISLKSRSELIQDLIGQKLMLQRMNCAIKKNIIQAEIDAGNVKLIDFLRFM